MSYTTNPISVAVQTPVDPEYMRLPRAGERDPICGLPRSVLNELILPCEDNGGHPPVRSVVLRKRGARTWHPADQPGLPPRISGCPRRARLCATYSMQESPITAVPA